jgi:moderate conductance mechanosensitive channel
VDVPVPVTEDLEQVTSIIRDLLANMASEEEWKGLLLGDPVVAGVETIEVGYVLLRLIARTLPGRQFEVARELRLRTTVALRDAGISSPPMAGEPA